jgi:hypothetical protein
MTTTTARASDGKTLARRFAAHLDNADGLSDLGSLVRSFDLSLRATNKSPKTIKSYTESVMGICLFLVEKGMPTDIRLLTREHIETYMADQVDRFRPKTALNRPGIPGGSIHWKRVWSHREEAKSQAVSA